MASTSGRKPVRRARIGLGACAAVVVTVGAAAGAVVTNWPEAFTGRMWFWLVACALGEAMWLRLPVGRATLSMASCFNLAALLVLPAGEALLVTAAASFAVEMAVMRKPLVRGAFNAAHTVLAVGAGSLAFRSAAGAHADPVTLISKPDLLPFVMAAVAYYAVNRAAVCSIVALHERVPPRRVWREAFGHAYEPLSAGAVFSLGVLLALHYSAIGPVGTVLVLLPLLIAFDGYRRRITEHRAGGSGEPERRAA